MDDRFSEEFNMSVESLREALDSGANAESVNTWVPRVAAVLLTITLLNPDIIKDHPEEISNYLRIITSMMPDEILQIAYANLAIINKIAHEVPIELYHEIQDAFKDFEPGGE